jgi:hypothetical protein
VITGAPEGIADDKARYKQKCVIDDDGSIGEPYARGRAELTPPCGVRYLRSSGDDLEIQSVNR